MLRPATDADRDTVLALGVAEEMAWFGACDITIDEVGRWVEDEGGLGRGMVVLAGSGSVVGFGSPGRHGSVFLADPGHTDLVADQLLPWMLGEREHVELLTFAGDAGRVAAFERHGLTHLRSSFFLSRPGSAGPLEPAAFPDGIDVARYAWGEADEAVHRMIYVDAAWASVAGHGERDLEAWLVKDRSCSSLFLARREGRPVGWVAGRILESGRGYILTLAVARSERGRGLGRALLLRAFADLQAAGAQGLALDVEAANEAALGLYRSVGLRVEREWGTYGR